MKLSVLREFKSLPPGAVSSIAVPMFMIITGPNGSGKSNLLEGLSNGAVVYDDFGQIDSEKVRLFGLGQLLAAAEGPVQAASFREPWAGLFNTVQGLVPSMRLELPSGSDEQHDNWLIERIVNSRIATRVAMTRMRSEAKKPIANFTSDDFRDHAPLVAGVRDPFAASIAEVFLSYSHRKTQNDFAQWRLEKKGEGTPLTDDQFIERFGPLPWKLFDETLGLVGLRYEFVPPPEDSDTTNYLVQLKNDDGQLITPDNLSSGERVLLAVAMSLFTGSKLSEAIELPRVLLLDEADASLHPSMVKSLLTVIEEVFVEQYGVRVILTTHSPSTVALASEDSLFVMNRSGERLKKASTDEALKHLTVGISSLSVKIENRQQVFVESEYDQAVYQEFFGLLRPRLANDKSLEFISVGKKSSGGGCDTVMRLTKQLRDAGNESIFGIVDRDNRRQAPVNVHFMSDRYSIENLVYDPLLLGVFLLREKIVTPEELGLPNTIRHYELKAEHAAPIISALASKLSKAGSPVSCTYLGGAVVPVPAEFFETRGHDLEAEVVAAYPALNRFGKNLMREIVKRAGGDLQGFVPTAVFELFERLTIE